MILTKSKIIMLNAKRNAILSGSFAILYPIVRKVKVWEFKNFSKKLDKLEEEEFDAGSYNPGDDPNNEGYASYKDYEESQN